MLEPEDSVAREALEKTRNFVEQYPSQTPGEEAMKGAILDFMDRVEERILES